MRCKSGIRVLQRKAMEKGRQWLDEGDIGEEDEGEEGTTADEVDTGIIEEMKPMVRRKDND